MKTSYLISKSWIYCLIVFGALCVFFVHGFSEAKEEAKDELLDFLGERKIERKVRRDKQEPRFVKVMKQKFQNKTAEQTIFLDFLAEKKYKKALHHWWASYYNTSFSKTPTGKALFAYLLIKNELYIVGLERLFEIKNPKKIFPSLAYLWKKSLPSDHPVWGIVYVPWKPQWTQFFGKQIALRVKSRQIKKTASLKQVQDLLNQVKPGSPEYNHLHWRYIVALSLNNHSLKARKALVKYLENEKLKEQRNLGFLTAGRLLFELGQLEPSLRFYKRVSKSSVYWFIAQEELAWVYIRKGEYGNTLATTQSLMVPDFSFQIGPEAIFLRSLAYLKICDYKGALDTVEYFRRVFSPRIKDLLKTLKRPNEKAIKALVESLEKGRLQLTDLGPYAKTLPSYVSRDQALLSRAYIYKWLNKELNKSALLYKESISGGTQVGNIGDLGHLKTAIEKRIGSLQREMNKIIQKRANEELISYRRIVKKMHIVEAEAMQQISLSLKNLVRFNRWENKKVAFNVGSTVKKGPYDLTFKFNGERWLDELGQFKVDVRKGSCFSTIQRGKVL